MDEQTDEQDNGTALKHNAFALTLASGKGIIKFTPKTVLLSESYSTQLRKTSKCLVTLASALIFWSWYRV